MATGVEAGGLRGQRHLHCGRVLLRQRGRHRDLLRRRDLLRLARHVRARLRARTDRPHAQDRTGRDAAHCALRERRAGHRGHRAADQPGDRGRAERRAVGARATRSRPASRASPPPPRREPCARSGSRSTARTAPPCSRGLPTPASATRSGARRSPNAGPTAPSRGPADARTPARAQREDRAGARARPGGRRARVRAHVVLVGRPHGHGRHRLGTGRTRRAGRGAVAQPPGAGRSRPRAAARGCVRGHDEPRPGDGTGAHRPRGARRGHGRRRAARPRGARTEGALVRERRARCSDRDRRCSRRRARRRESPARRRGGDAHERHHRAAQAHPAHVRDVLAGTRRRQALRAQPERRRAPAPRRDHRELTDGAPRRAVPPAAVRERRPILLPAGTLPRRRMDRRGASPSSPHREPGSRGAAHGARRRPRPGRLREHPFRHLRHRAPRTRRRRRLLREIRRARAHLVRGHRVRGRGRGLEPGRPRALLGDQARQRRAGARGVRAARRRRGERRAPATRRGGTTRGEGAPDGRRHGLDPHDRSRPHRCRRLRVDPRSRRPGDHPGRVQDPARRRARHARTRPARFAVPRSSAATMRASAQFPSPRSSCVRVLRQSAPTRCSRKRRRCSPRYELPAEVRIVATLPRTPSGKVDLTAVRALFGEES